MFLSEGSSLRGQITYPKINHCFGPNDDEFILQVLTDLGESFKNIFIHAKKVLSKPDYFHMNQVYKYSG